MKHPVTTLATGMALGAALCVPTACSHEGALSAATAAAPTLPESMLTITPADARLAREVVKDNLRYWTARQVGIASTRLVLLSRNETFVCKASEPGSMTAKLSALSTSEYCPSSHTIIGTALDFNAQNALGRGALGIAFTMSHETGHAVEQAEGRLREFFTNPSVHTDMELQATEYAGEYMSTAYSPAQISSLARYIRTVPMDGLHGTANQQADALLSGADLPEQLHGAALAE